MAMDGIKFLSNSKYIKAIRTHQEQNQNTLNTEIVYLLKMSLLACNELKIIINDAIQIFNVSTKSR